MPILPDMSLALLDFFTAGFTRPSYRRFLALLGAAILTTGRRTVANLLCTAGSLAPGHPSSYRRVFSPGPLVDDPTGLPLAGALVALGGSI